MEYYKIINCTLDQINILKEIEDKIWGKLAASQEELILRIKKNKRSTFLYLEKNKCFGSITMIPAIFSEITTKKWSDILTYIRKKYSNHNDCLYLISLGALPNAPHNTASRMIKFAEIEGRKKQLKYLVCGARVPNYHKFINKLSIEEYIKKVQDNKIFDPVLSLAFLHKFSVYKISENFLKDEASNNYGIIVYKRIS